MKRVVTESSYNVVLYLYNSNFIKLNKNCDSGKRINLKQRLGSLLEVRNQELSFE